MMSEKIIVVHEFDGPKYFEALIELKKQEKLDELYFVESSVIKQFVRNIVRDKKSFRQAAIRAVENVRFRLRVPFIQNHLVILAIPPWDFRMVWYGLIAKRNRLIYHTSWPNWNIDRVPRKYGIFSHVFRWCWYRTLNLPNLQIVTVISEAKAHLSKHFPETQIDVIPHVVSPEFNEVSPDNLDGCLKVLFVGELSEKKGVKLLEHIIKKLENSKNNFCVGVVGTGPLNPLIDNLVKCHDVTSYGRVTDRKKLAGIYAEHHILLVPSQRTSRWEELFGMVIVEAMTVGLPVIASKHIGPRSIITDGEDGFLVSEESVDQFVDCIQHLYQNIDAWGKMSNKSMATGRSYSLSFVSLQWCKLIAQ